MAAFLRGAAAQAHRAALQPRNLSSAQQVRFAGDLPVKTNKHIEAWGARRETLEETFEWNGSLIVISCEITASRAMVMTGALQTPAHVDVPMHAWRKHTSFCHPWCTSQKLSLASSEPSQHAR
ncbi:hypothetical protein WJX74_008375 [Apatococcus lobatus]|uniref:Uncharacterized protein n=1 Tax=Apatococcus lobatus TaxID=904363 RepID=A0AAW1QU70_9CHLO